MYGGTTGTGGGERDVDRGDFGGTEELAFDQLRLGHDVRFLFVAVGGGGIRVGREVARRHPRYVETIAIHCESSVQGMEEFDRRVTLEPRGGEDPDTPPSAGSLARAAEPALERIFDGAAFVTIVGSLGGTAGSGVFPSVVDAASRAAVVVSVFAIKPFVAEAERRSLADRTLGRLPFLEAFVEKQQRGSGRLAILDNEVLAQQSPKMPFNGVARHWADLLGQYMEREIIHPAEAAVEANRRLRIAESGPINRVAPEIPALQRPEEEIPSGVPVIPRYLPAALARPDPDAELTFEIVGPQGPQMLR
jgi:hypothetical protein